MIGAALRRVLSNALSKQRAAAHDDGDRVFYCYVFVRTDTDTPFYVGKGRDRRSETHWTKSHNKRLRQLLVELGRAGVRVDHVASDLTEAEALICERAAIAFYGREIARTGPLVNLTKGGEGVSGTRAGDEVAIRKRVDEIVTRAAEAERWKPEAVRRRLFALWNAQ